MWLIERDTWEKMNAAAASGFVPTADQIEAMNISAVDGDQSGLMIAGDVASISVKGVLTDAPDFFARFFGGGNTVYSDIINALAAADANPEVTRAELNVDSPGGTASAAWQSAMDAVANFSKPITAVTRGRALSAAYGIAAMADEIQALNNLSAFGSVGALATMRVDDSIIEISSTNAPDKRPDPATAAGKATIRAMVDQVENQFISMVSQGRGISEAKIKANFGRGGVVLASEAQNRGMIDSILAKTETPVKTSKTPKAISAGHNKGVQSMDLATFKAEHPSVFADAVQAGVTQESERVQAHLTLAKAYGDDAMAIAVDCIEKGKHCGQLEQAQYMAAGVKNTTLNAHAAGDEAAAAALKAKTNAEELEANGGAENLETQVVNGVAALMGVELQGA